MGKKRSTFVVIRRRSPFVRVDESGGGSPSFPPPLSPPFPQALMGDDPSRSRSLRLAGLAAWPCMAVAAVAHTLSYFLPAPLSFLERERDPEEVFLRLLSFLSPSSAHTRPMLTCEPGAAAAASKPIHEFRS